MTSPNTGSARSDDPVSTALRTVDAQTTERLHTRLVAMAERESLLDVAYRIVDSPVGALLLAATPAGLVRIAFERQGHDAVLAELAAAVSPRVLEAPAQLTQAARRLDEYFDGRRAWFDIPLDLRLSRGFRRDVLAQLGAIGYGQTASYGTVAAATGSPRAARAVGSACRTNPLPLVVPCHRVLRSDGSTGDYVGGAAAKRALLALEGIPVVKVS